MIKKAIKKILIWNVHNYEMEKYRKITLGLMFFSVSIFYLVVMGIIAFVQHAIILGLTDFGFTMLVVMFMIFLIKVKRYELYLNILIIMSGLMFFSLYIMGGVENSAMYWCFMFPVLAALIVGHKRCMLYSSIMMIMIIGSQILVHQNLISISGKQSISIFIRYIAVYSTITVVSCIAEWVRSITYNRMIKYYDDMTNTIKELESTRASLRELTNIDPLTEIYNKRFLNAKVPEMVKTGDESYIVSMFFDLDDFKMYNDYYGHIEGDKVLIKVVNIIKNQIRNFDGIFARFGGEELVYIMKTDDTQDPREIAIRVIADINEANIVNLGSKNGYVTVSIGIASCKMNELENWEDIVKKSDNAMYQAKRKGKNTFYVA